MSRPIALGASDFRELRARGAAYVDKTAMIGDIVADPGEAILLPRPRRFGKTLNLTMLQAFFQRSEEDLAPLFDGLAVRDAGDDVWRHFQRYPVIFLTFKDVKEPSWDRCFDAVRGVLAGLLRSQRQLLDGDGLAPDEREIFTSVLTGRADESTCASILRLLSEWLHRAHGERVVILVDEYDTPIHAGVHGGYYEDVLGFFRNLLSGGLKDNRHLFKGVVTGILRVAKESLFSGLNNLAVYPLLRPEYATAFGFTPAEVAALAAEQGAPEQVDDLALWYDGYLFGGQTIYNPWSVLSFLASRDRVFRPYWVATSSDELLRDLLADRAALPASDIAAILDGRGVDRVLDDNLVLRDLDQRADAVWSFLVFSGYLRAEGPTGEDRFGRPLYRLSVPNREVGTLYPTLFLSWLEQRVGGQGGLATLGRAVLDGDADTLERILEPLLVQTFSHLDLGGRQPERVYQAFLVGLLVHLAEDYEVRSNPESGFGRSDVLVLPRRPGLPGVVMELKVLSRRQTPEAALDAAFRQMRDKDYAQALRERGASPIHELALVFDGKRAWARSG